MTAYHWGQAGGALIICTIVTLLLHGASRTWPKSVSKIVFINCIAAIIEVLLSAVGNGISAEATPSWRTARQNVVVREHSEPRF
jgi:hypothetical protein